MAWIYSDFSLIENPSGIGYVQDGSIQYYKNILHTIGYGVDQPLHALQLSDGTFSRTYSKGYLVDGNHSVMDYQGRIKHQITRTDIAGTADASGDYFKLAQNYPLVQSADLTDTLVDDHTADEPTNAVVSVATLANVTGDQIFATKDSGDLEKLGIYDKEMSASEVVIIKRFFGIV